MPPLLQITEEPNFTTFPYVDGSIPNVRQALVQGVITAKKEVRAGGYAISVGFNAALSFAPQDDFWAALPALGGSPFLDALDYVGMDFFPDVYRPLEPEALSGAVRDVLMHFRQVNMAAGHIPASVLLHITENGWPTGPDRSYERQADVLETTVRLIHELRGQLTITHYEYFALRDISSAQPDKNFQFGLLRDDYTPKPAFERYQQLISELGIAVP